MTDGESKFGSHDGGMWCDYCGADDVTAHVRNNLDKAVIEVKDFTCGSGV